MRVQLIESFSATVNGRALALPGTQAPRILALLAMESGRTVPHERIRSMLWPDRAPATADRQVSNQLSVLRGALRSAGFEGLTTRNRVCVLEGAATDIDLLDADVSTARALARERRFDQALPLLRRCAESIPDEPLGGLAGEAFHAESIRLLSLRNTLRLEIADCLRHAGGHREGAAVAASLFAADRLSGKVARILMDCLLGAGERAKALAVFEEHRTALSELLGIDPDAETADLHLRLLREESGRDGPRAEPTGPVPRELPASPHVFVGREAEIDELSHAMGEVRGTPGVVCLNGPGGMGKSSAAIQLAHREAGGYPDGQVYLDLQGHTPGSAPTAPEDALRSLLRSFGAPVAESADRRELVSLWRTASSAKRALLVFDNVRDSAQVRDLLPGSGECGVIVTSRRMLALPQACAAIRLEPLGPEESARLVGEYLGGERWDEHRESVERIVLACAGMPLALGIAAAECRQAGAGRTADFASRLEAETSRLKALEVDDFAVRASIAMSVAELEGTFGVDSDIVGLFRLLGQFPGTVLSVNAVASGLAVEPGEARTLLDRLVAYELASHDGDRYKVQGLIRAYSAERAPRDWFDEGRPVFVERLAGYYAATMDRAVRTRNPKLNPRSPTTGPGELPAGAVPESFADMSSAASWYGREEENFTALLAMSAPYPRTAPLWAVMALRAGQLHPDYGTSPRAVDRMIDRAASDPRLLDRRQLYAVRTARYMRLLRVGDGGGAAAEVDRYMTEADLDGVERAYCLSQKANGLYFAGRSTEAASVAEEAASLAVAVSSPEAEHYAFMFGSRALEAAGDHAGACRSADRCVDAADRVGQAPFTTDARRSRVFRYVRAGRVEEAAELLAGLGTGREGAPIPGRRERAEHLWAEGEVLRALGRADEAAARFAEAVTLLRRGGVLSDAEYRGLVRESAPEAPFPFSKTL
ncbi:AfsR/SARP family transcriptional regulator [Salininema proteolyticum]|uniref:BTAD domain-containing putative transcriptional regulator n=1 Tax=Salininema proteolyticum TaxID=1607685 RepID=A0ABV8TWE8_9ACTN